MEEEAILLSIYTKKHSRWRYFEVHVAGDLDRSWFRNLVLQGARHIPAHRSITYRCDWLNDLPVMQWGWKFYLDRVLDSKDEERARTFPRLDGVDFAFYDGPKKSEEDHAIPRTM